MKRVFSSIFLLLAFGFLLVSNAKGGEREDNLIGLALSGDVDGVRGLLDQGVDVNAKGKNDCTALVGELWLYKPAHAQNHVDLVRLLLARGADINKVGCVGFTPLTMAALYGLPDIVRILIDQGVDVNKKDDNGNTALMRVNQLLEKGRETGFDKSFHLLYTPLTPVERETYTNIVRMLQAAGAK